MLPQNKTKAEEVFQHLSINFYHQCVLSYLGLCSLKLKDTFIIPLFL